MNKRLARATVLAQAIGALAVTGGATLSGTARAQSAAVEDELKEVVVTGSRLDRPADELPTPISVVSEDFLQQNSGSFDLGKALALQPSMGFSGTIEASQNSGAGATRGADTGGYSRADLRKLGSNRTLVLVNGRRRVSGSVDSFAVDLNSIMPAMIERVEIITGGASAVYGSDAVSGVVNFITRKGFDGLQLDADMSSPVAGSFGSTVGGSLLFGSDFHDGRGNVTFGVAHSRRKAVVPSDVKNMRNWGAVLNPADTGLGDGIPQRVLLPDTGREWGAYGAIGYSNDTGTVGRVRFDVNGNPEPLPTRVGVVDANWAYFGDAGCGEYCFYLTDFITVSPEQDRTNAVASFFYEIHPVVEFYGDFSLTDSTTRGRGQSNQIDGTDSHVINVRDNPYLAPSLRAALLAQNRTSVRMVKGHDEVGRLFSEVDRRTLTASLGFRGTLQGPASGIRYDAYYGYGQSEVDFTLPNRMLVANTAAAIDAVVDPADGVIKCRMDVPAMQPTGYVRPAVIGSTPCAPFNIFGPYRSSEAAREFVRTTIYRSQLVQQTIAGLTLSGDSSKWFSLPGGGPLSVAVGAERREERGETKNDGLLKGPFIIRPERATDMNAGFDVDEWFVEASLPVLEGRRFTNKLTLDAAYRRADYTHAGAVEAWKVGMFWEPITDIRLRATKGTAVRAPNLVEAFRPNETSSAGVQDACSQENVNLNPNRLANCTALGRPTGWVNPLGGRTLPLNVSGNPTLDVETSDSWTAGVTFTPRFLDRFSVSFDWYNIEIEDAITLVTAANVVSNCVDNPGAPDPRYCAFVERDLTPGSPFFFALTSIGSTYINASKLATSGLDMTADYDFPAWNGTVALRLVGSFVKTLRQYPFQTNPAVFIEDVGYTNAPKYAGILSASYSTGPWTLSWQTRYQSSADTTSTLGRNREILDVNSTGNIYYHDVGVAYDFSTKAGGIDAEAFLGVQNILDREIPKLRVQEWFNSGGRYLTNGATVYAGFRWRH